MTVVTPEFPLTPYRKRSGLQHLSLQPKVRLPLRPALVLIVALSTGFASCTSLQRLSPSARRDYYHDAFQCKLPKANLKEEYGRYLKSHTEQRIFNGNTNAGKSRSFAVITGDSIAALFRPHLLKAMLPEYEILNTGVGGDTTDLFLLRLEKDVLSYRPRVIILSIGGNDLLHRRCVPFILATVEKIIEAVRKKSPKTTILLTSVPPVYNRRLNSIVLFYNIKLRHLAAAKRYVEYVDLWRVLSDPSEPRLARPYRIVYRGHVDEVHFNQQGYQKWAELLRPILRRLKSTGK